MKPDLNKFQSFSILAHSCLSLKRIRVEVARFIFMLHFMLQTDFHEGNKEDKANENWLERLKDLHY